MSKIKNLIDIGKKLFGKKKVKEKFKPDTSKVPTSKNISSLIAKEQDPFVRNKLQSIKESAARGDVISKSGNVIATPTKERTAKTSMERNPGSYQRRVPEAKGGRIGYKSGSKGCKLATKGKGRAYGQNS